MGLPLSRTLRDLFGFSTPGAPVDTSFDTEAAIARYLAQRERSIDIDASPGARSNLRQNAN